MAVVNTIVVIGMIVLQAAVSYDPFSLLFLMFFASIVTGLAVYFFVVLRDSSNQTALINSQINALNSQVNNMNNMVQAIVTALNVNTAMYEREVQHRMEMDNRYLDLYRIQVDNDVYFKNTLLELYGLQLTNKDLMELLKQKNQGNTSGNTSTK